MKIEWGISNGLHNVIYADTTNPNKFGDLVLELLSLHATIPLDYKWNKELNRQLAGSKELMKYREEREWRYIGKMTNELKKEYHPLSIQFTREDIDAVICPRNDKDRLMKFLERHSFEDLINKIVSPH